MRASLESIFSHLFQEPDPEEGEAEDRAAAPPPDEAEAAAAAAEAEAAAPEAEVEVEAPAEAEAPRAFTPGMGPNPVLHYAQIPYEDRVNEINEELEQRLVGAKYANTHLAFQRDRAAKKDAAVLFATDFEFGREQRKTGLPPVDSQLALDVSLLEEHGLLHPHGIITRVQKERRSPSP